MILYVFGYVLLCVAGGIGIVTVGAATQSWPLVILLFIATVGACVAWLSKVSE